ncbi:hypothetical protein COU57_03560 [Candidatus Pacearchaeota archaeon CG10_big_fil_rev_8_21_14_0_10_32_14]|nr:MAG: hypothetical protein COU57_03560 [Candidatus Pacearchaeota archaeon CG10_big_fil_rev_8_21_14_0_10_32_14]
MKKLVLIVFVAVFYGRSSYSQEYETYRPENVFYYDDYKVPEEVDTDSLIKKYLDIEVLDSTYLEKIIDESKNALYRDEINVPTGARVTDLNGVIHYMLADNPDLAIARKDGNNDNLESLFYDKMREANRAYCELVYAHFNLISRKLMLASATKIFIESKIIYNPNPDMTIGWNSSIANDAVLFRIVKVIEAELELENKMDDIRRLMGLIRENEALKIPLIPTVIPDYKPPLPYSKNSLKLALERDPDVKKARVVANRSNLPIHTLKLKKEEYRVIIELNKLLSRVNALLEKVSDSRNMLV